MERIYISTMETGSLFFQVRQHLIRCSAFSQRMGAATKPGGICVNFVELKSKRIRTKRPRGVKKQENKLSKLNTFHLLNDKSVSLNPSRASTGIRSTPRAAFILALEEI